MYVLMEKMKFYVIAFNTQTLKVEAEVVEYKTNRDDIYDKLCMLLNCDSLEFVDYSEDIVVIVDENGKFKPNNPVFNVITQDGYSVELAGKIIFARNIENEYSTDIGSIKYEDIFNLRTQLQIQLIGVTKGE